MKRHGHTRSLGGGCLRTRQWDGGGEARGVAADDQAHGVVSLINPEDAAQPSPLQPTHLPLLSEETRALLTAQGCPSCPKREVLSQDLAPLVGAGGGWGGGL